MAACTFGDRSNAAMIGIIDYSAGNIRSVKNALSWIGSESRLIGEPRHLRDVSGVILPGVGAFGPAIAELERTGLADAIREWAIERQRPLFGVCLGMQLLARRSDEDGEHLGLGIVPADIIALQPRQSARIPHVGWNIVEKARPSRIWGELDHATCYFAHSFHLAFAEASDIAVYVAGKTNHGEQFVSMLEHDNVMGAQFHPEKSQSDGLAILRNFVDAAQSW